MSKVFILSDESGPFACTTFRPNDEELDDVFAEIDQEYELESDDGSDDAIPFWTGVGDGVVLLSDKGTRDGKGDWTLSPVGCDLVTFRSHDEMLAHFAE